jgi:uncharacterized protein YndB with AHSA1/START domain
MAAQEMIPAQIEKEIVIAAPIEVVWRIITEPDQIKQWFSPEAELEGRPGGEGRFKFESGNEYYLQVEAVEPPHRFAYRWMHEKGTKARPENSMLVEFILRAEADGTRLRVVESGFETVDWAEEVKTKYADDHSRGWQYFLGRLRDHAPHANLTPR